MSSEEQREAALQDVEKELADLLATEPEQLVRTEDLGKALDFSSGQPVFERRLRLFRRLQHAGLTDLPLPLLENVRNSVSHARAEFQQVMEFSPTGQNPQWERDNLIQQIESQYQGEFDTVGLAIAYGQQTGTNLEQIRRTAGETLDAVKAAREEALSELDEVRRTAESVKRAAAEVGVSQHATQFQKEADDHRSTSKRWFYGVAAVGALTAVLAALNIWWLYEAATEGSLDLGQAVQISVAKLLLFSVLYFGLVWLVRMYRSACHNHVVNQHRANALQTFETFVNAATSHQTKEAVLMRATDSIFGHQASGFDEARRESGSANLLEITRDLGRGAGTE
ncbi:MAG: hypothetical protein OXH70_06540 [Acidobacteria bacterium]|nr:hypothetical protein [Acidobacteriota bacterium]